ncbi:M15 family metallopeptidase [Flaviaesturariibacter amylovorans]
MSCRAQNIRIVRKSKIYRHQVAADSALSFLELKDAVPGVLLDLHYATPANFTGKRLYRQGEHTFLRRAPARALARVQAALQAEGLGLKVWDAYRPHAATRLMWELVRDERYVANPKKGSGHNRGLAVDLTLVDSRGQELDLGTRFDNFTDTAHSNFKELPPDVLANRKKLRTAMEAAGFTVLATEWWHFYWPNDRNYDVMDLDFRVLLKEYRKSK